MFYVNFLILSIGLGQQSKDKLSCNLNTLVVELQNGDFVTTFKGQAEILIFSNTTSRE